MKYPAEDYEFRACTQETDGELKPPDGPGWLLIRTNAAEDGDAAILIATWARLKNPVSQAKP
jgi:hypothetical protein